MGGMFNAIRIAAAAGKATVLKMLMENATVLKMLMEMEKEAAGHEMYFWVSLTLS